MRQDEPYTDCWARLERVVIHTGHELAKARRERFQDLFGGDSLASDVARLQVARKTRKQLEWATTRQIESVIEEVLTP